MGKRDLFEMPVVDIDCSRSIKELQGLLFVDKPLKGYILAVVAEALKLKINESGAKIESRAILVATKSAVPCLQKPREFILDK